MTGISDSYERPINYLRISVTDRCNLRCIYCMPAGGVPLTEHQNILSYEEIHTVVRAAAGLGISKVRITGGEPLVRAGISRLIEMIAQTPGITDVSLTTNASLLKGYARELKAAGLARVNISLDTLKDERFREITRTGTLSDVIEGIGAAQAAGLTPVKINTIIMAGINDDEINDFAKKTLTEGWHVRFIELMPSTGNGQHASALVTTADIMSEISRLGELTPSTLNAGSGPARYYRLPGAEGTVGFITPVTEHFCFECNRIRLTADGRLRPCLLSEQETDIRGPLRSSASFAQITEIIESVIVTKPHRHELAHGVVPQNRSFSQLGG